MKTMHRWLIVGLLGVATTGCVKKGVYEDALARLAAEAAEHEATRSTLEATRADLLQQLASCEARAADLSEALAMTEESLSQCQQQLEDARTMLEASGEESRLLAARLQELASIEVELRERDRIFGEIVGAFRQLIDNGFVEVVIERGRLVIKMPQDILFESGRAEIGPEGEVALVEVAGVLGRLTTRTFQVEGHTDNVPISTRQFPSNWELSAARALAVVHLFEQNGVAPTNISAGGFGEWQPRAGNETPDDRALNRRIEIVMVPDLEAIFGRISP